MARESRFEPQRGLTMESHRENAERLIVVTFPVRIRLLVAVALLSIAAAVPTQAKNSVRMAPLTQRPASSMNRRC